MRYNIYCDMDGVLANFNKEKNALERFKIEKNFFYKLEPIKSNVLAINKLLKKHKEKIFILTSSPNLQADEEKIKWLNKFIPTLKKENIIIIRNGENKAEYVLTEKNNILFDDWGKNIRDFENKGFIGLQIKKYQTITRLLHKNMII